MLFERFTASYLVTSQIQFTDFRCVVVYFQCHQGIIIVDEATIHHFDAFTICETMDLERAHFCDFAEFGLAVGSLAEQITP